MSVTILEALQNAQYNLDSQHPLMAQTGKNQLSNAVILLNKGYSIHDEVDPILTQYGSAEAAPDKD